MARTKGSKNKNPISESEIHVRLSTGLLEKIDSLAHIHGQNRSETVLEALRKYVSENKWELDRLEEKK